IDLESIADQRTLIKQEGPNTKVVQEVMTGFWKPLHACALQAPTAPVKPEGIMPTQHPPNRTRRLPEQLGQQPVRAELPVIDELQGLPHMHARHELLSPYETQRSPDHLASLRWSLPCNMTRASGPATSPVIRSSAGQFVLQICTRSKMLILDTELTAEYFILGAWARGLYSIPQITRVLSYHPERPFSYSRPGPFELRRAVTQTIQRSRRQAKKYKVGGTWYWTEIWSPNCPAHWCMLRGMYRHMENMLSPSWWPNMTKDPQRQCAHTVLPPLSSMDVGPVFRQANVGAEDCMAQDPKVNLELGSTFAVVKDKPVSPQADAGKEVASPTTRVVREEKQLPWLPPMMTAESQLKEVDQPETGLYQIPPWSPTQFGNGGGTFIKTYHTPNYQQVVLQGFGTPQFGHTGSFKPAVPANTPFHEEATVKAPFGYLLSEPRTVMNLQNTSHQPRESFMPGLNIWNPIVVDDDPQPVHQAPVSVEAPQNFPDVGGETERHIIHPRPMHGIPLLHRRSAWEGSSSSNPVAPDDQPLPINNANPVSTFDDQDTARVVDASRNLPPVLNDAERHEWYLKTFCGQPYNHRRDRWTGPAACTHFKAIPKKGAQSNKVTKVQQKTLKAARKKTSPTAPANDGLAVQMTGKIVQSRRKRAEQTAMTKGRSQVIDGDGLSPSRVSPRKPPKLVRSDATLGSSEYMTLPARVSKGVMSSDQDENKEDIAPTGRHELGEHTSVGLSDADVTAVKPTSLVRADTKDKVVEHTSGHADADHDAETELKTAAWDAFVDVKEEYEKANTAWLPTARKRKCAIDDILNAPQEASDSSERPEKRHAALQADQRITELSEDE
ncbi:MAG: hypothetical protein Q9218_006860, partial [Villophora microphyllina]